MSDDLNESILGSNFGDEAGGSMEFELSPEPEVVETEFVEVPEPQSRSPRKNLLVAAAILVLAGGSGAFLFSPYGQRMLGGHGKPQDDLAFLEAPVGDAAAAAAPASDANPFSRAPAAKDLTTSGVGQGGSIEDRLPATSLDTPSRLDESAPLTVADAQKPEVVPSQSPAPTSVKADGSRTDQAPKSAVANEVAQPVVATTAHQSPPVTEKPVTEKPEAEKPAAEPTVERAPTVRHDEPTIANANTEIETMKKAAPSRSRAAAPNARQIVRHPPKSRQVSAGRITNHPGKMRTVMEVTAQQIGLRELTSDRIVVTVDRKDLKFHVSDVLPSGERIEKIDPVAMAVITDRTVIRVKQ